MTGCFLWRQTISSRRLASPGGLRELVSEAVERVPTSLGFVLLGVVVLMAAR